VLDRTETLIGELRVSADRRQRDQLLEFAASFTPRTWAIESACGLGALLAQQLVAAGETVFDVPPTLSARVRLLDSGCTEKTGPHHARAAAIVTLRHTRLRQVTPVDRTAVLRLLADRHHDLIGLRAQAICRLHALLCGLTPGGAGRLLSAPQAGRILRGVRPLEPVEIEPKRIALELLGDVRLPRHGRRLPGPGSRFRPLRQLARAHRERPAVLVPPPSLPTTARGDAARSPARGLAWLRRQPER
jgi:hypothetical protein